jgi:DNA-binding NarL/FixJ family response regulator
MIEKFTKLVNNKKNYTDILTEKEIAITRLIVRGESNKSIAKSLNYSEGTVKNIVSRIYEKLDISDRLQLAVYAVENGID